MRPTSGRILPGAWAAAVVALGMPAWGTGQEGSPSFRRFGLEEGLSQESALTVVQDSTGYLWVGTQNGLNRWDGTTFRHFTSDPTDSTTLSDPYVRALSVDSRGTLWVGTYRGGLNRWDPATETFRRFPDVAGGQMGAAPAIWDIVEAPSGRLWLATAAGPVVFDPGTESAARPIGGMPDSSDARAIALGPDGRMWIGSTEGDLTFWPPRGGGSEASGRTGGLNLGAAVHVIHVLAPDSVLVGTAAGLVLLDGDGEVLQGEPLGAGEPGDDGALWVHDVRRDRYGHLWVGTRQGLVDISPDGSRFRYLPDPADGASLPHVEVTDILEDRMGVLWIGTWGGLASLSPYRNALARYPRIRERPGTPGVGRVIAIAEDRRGALWLGTMGGAVHRLERTDGSMATLSQASTANVYSLALDEGGAVWAGMVGGGVLRLDPGSGRVTPVPFAGDAGDDGSAEDVVAVHVDRSGNVWAGTVDSGLHRLGPDGRFSTWGTGDEPWTPAEPYVWPIREDSVGNLWVGTNGGRGGVHRISPDRRSVSSVVRDPASPSGFPDGRVLTLIPTGDGIVWIGTQGGGLVRLDPGTGETDRWLETDGLPHNTVEGILADDQGFLWVSTNDGLARFDPRTEEFRVLRLAAGLQDNRFFANSAYRSSSGELFFGGNGGLTVLRPGELRWPEDPPAIALTGISVLDTSVPAASVARGNRLTLAPDENSFTLRFSAFDFVDPGLTRYRYRLEGLDSEWIDNGASGVAVYRSVPPGRYEFRVAARNSAGVWNQSGLSLPIVVRAPYYKTAWFRLLVLFTFGGLVAAAYTYRTREQLRIQELRLAIAGKLHDDVGANLSAIAMRADMVRRLGGLDEDVVRKLGEVGRLARETAQAVRETVWVVNTDYDTLDKLLAKMRDTAEVMTAGQIALSFDAPPDIPGRRIGWEVRQDVYYLFKEALHNVIKHARASRVDISVRWTPPDLILVVVDDGRGFDVGGASEGNGLGLMRRRASRNGGRLLVDTAPGRGTRLKARIPVR